MKYFKVFFIYLIIVSVILIVVLTVVYYKNKDIYINECSDNNIGYYVEKAIKQQYPRSIVINTENNYHESRGPYVVVKILTFGGIRTEIFKCGEIYHEEQCVVNYLRKNDFYAVDDNEKYDIIRLNSCYYDLATFNADKSLCYKITEKETQDHCFKFIIQNTNK